MPEFSWPKSDDAKWIGKKVARIDGPAKVTGAARYSYDVNRPGMLYAAVLRCPHAHARIVSIDVSPAEAMPGVRTVRVVQGEGAEIKWALDEIAFVAATSEDIARDAVGAIRIEYEVLEHFVTEEDKDSAAEVSEGSEQVTGDPDGAFSSAATRAKGYYGLYSVAHCSLEPHGQVCEWEGEQNLTAWASTQAVTGLPGQFAEGVEIPAANVRVVTDYMGGGFGSKFSVDRWGVECARMAREARAPVKLMLERDAELTVAGDRPSTFAEVEVAADAEGNLTAWSSRSWGSGGLGGAGSPPLPYVFQVPNRKHAHSSVVTNIASSRAWRAPNHPQACLVTMAALEDLAAALRMDPLDFFNKNLQLTGPRAETYREEFEIAAELMDWKRRWSPRGESGKGSVRQGLGLSLHTWGGQGHQSNCELVVHPDGSVQIRTASQDLGTGTKTVIAIVVAETFGLPVDRIKVHIGDSRFPASGASGGSTTVGGVSSAVRRAAQTALAELMEKVAEELEVPADELEAGDSRIFLKTNPERGLSWEQAAGLLGVAPLTIAGANPGPGRLTDSGAGGVQMADVSVDVETGVVKLNKIVAVQDCGLVVDLLTASSQVYGALIMGIAYALTEEKIIDPVSGRMLNAEMEFYKLPGIGDVGELVVHMMQGEGYDERGVIGLGEPPVISPGAAISNAVANAIGVRVPHLPLTPERVLEAIEKGGVA